MQGRGSPWDLGYGDVLELNMSIFGRKVMGWKCFGSEDPGTLQDLKGGDTVKIRCGDTL